MAENKEVVGLLSDIAYKGGMITNEPVAIKWFYMVILTLKDQAGLQTPVHVIANKQMLREFGEKILEIAKICK